MTPKAQINLSNNNKQKIDSTKSAHTSENVLTVSYQDPYGFKHTLTSPNDRIDKVVFEGFENVTELIKHSGPLLGNKYRYRCNEITSVDLSGLSNITTINHDCFLDGFTSLTSIDLSPFKNVTSICENFLSRCESLVNIDLSPLKNVTSIGHGFLDLCTINMICYR